MRKPMDSRHLMARLRRSLIGGEKAAASASHWSIVRACEPDMRAVVRAVREQAMDLYTLAEWLAEQPTAGHKPTVASSFPNH